MVFANIAGELFDARLSASGWTKPRALHLKTTGSIALATVNGTSVLLSEGADGALERATYNASGDQWSALSSIHQTTTGSFALCAFEDIATSTERLMLCWAGTDGFIQSMLGDESGFTGDVVPVNQLTDGAMTLGQVGASLFLVYKERNSRKMRMTSYNTGPFNAFKAHNFQDQPAPENDTTLHQWSVTDFTVGHFAKKMAALANEYQNFGNMAMDTVSGEMHLVHRGGYVDKSNAYTEVFGLTGIYSAANQFSNGYGTLDQAGWTDEEEMTEVQIAPTSPIAMCNNGKQLTLVWADSSTGSIQYRVGGYGS